MRSKRSEYLVQDSLPGEQPLEYRKRQHQAATQCAEHAARRVVQLIGGNKAFATRHLVLEIIADGFCVQSYLWDYAIELVEAATGVKLGKL